MSPCRLSIVAMASAGRVSSTTCPTSTSSSSLSPPVMLDEAMAIEVAVNWPNG